jgi:hypothetical protein
MKVKFNLPSKRYTNNFSFDNNTTLGIGNVQPLFCKSLVAGSKVSIGFSQLTRLSPLVVPTFARLKQRNDFCFVPISMVMPSYDAFLSNTIISGSKSQYIPKSLPTISNEALFCSLITHFADVGVFDTTTTKWLPKTGKKFNVLPFGYETSKVLNVSFPGSALTESELSRDGFDFMLDSTSSFLSGLQSKEQLYIRLNQIGRYWYTVLRGLGYTCDPRDTRPVSILPLWAFARAYYDLYFPKRYNSWHSTSYYKAINRHYNGYFKSKTNHGLVYDYVENWDCLTSLYGDFPGFDFFASVDDSLATAANDQPINGPAAAHKSNIERLSSPDPQSDGDIGYVDSNPGGEGNPNGSNIPAVNVANFGSDIGIAADQFAIVNKLWNFVSKSSAVGQSVKDWFKVHFGVNPNEDMFNSTHLIDSVVNDVSINTVVSTAQTTDGSRGDNLGALAGQGYASKHGRVKYEASTFGFCFCLTSLVPVSGVSTGTQPELYMNTYYEQPFPDFDGLGYEVLNKSSFIETFADIKKRPNNVDGGFGYVPRLSSHKSLHNIRSGLFATNSTKDSFIPYCIDVIPVHSMTSGLAWRMPWSMASNFLSFNRIFYNTDLSTDKVGDVPLDDNFMTQTSFDFSYTSYLKPLSDTYSVEQLGKNIISVKQQ